MNLYSSYLVVLSVGVLLVGQSAVAQDARNIPDDDREPAYQVYKELIEYKTFMRWGEALVQNIHITNLFREMRLHYRLSQRLKIIPLTDVLRKILF